MLVLVYTDAWFDFLENSSAALREFSISILSCSLTPSLVLKFSSSSVWFDLYFEFLETLFFDFLEEDFCLRPLFGLLEVVARPFFLNGLPRVFLDFGFFCLPSWLFPEG